MSTMTADAPAAPKPKRRAAPRSGTHVIWPKGLEERLGVSPVTRWRMEKDGRIPPRDVFLDGKPIGWKPATADRALAAA